MFGPAFYDNSVRVASHSPSIVCMESSIEPRACHRHTAANDCSWPGRASHDSFALAVVPDIVIAGADKVDFRVGMLTVPALLVSLEITKRTWIHAAVLGVLVLIIILFLKFRGAIGW